MVMDRWEPARDVLTLQAAMDRLFGDSAAAVPAPGRDLATLPVDISETENDYLVRASVPGIDPDAIEISLHRNTLTLRVERAAEPEQQGRRWLVRERRHGAAQRTITFPTPIKPNACDAEYEHGVLTLILPKSDEARPKRIPITNQRESHRAGRPQVASQGGPAAGSGPS